MGMMDSISALMTSDCERKIDRCEWVLVLDCKRQADLFIHNTITILDLDKYRTQLAGRISDLCIAKGIMGYRKTAKFELLSTQLDIEINSLAQGNSDLANKVHNTFANRVYEYARDRC